MTPTAAVLALLAAPAGDGGFAWLAGCWRSETAARVAEEIWIPPAGGLMLGLSRTVQGGEARAFEFLRIETRGEAAFVAQPGGGAPVHFPLVEAGETSAAFENPDHDYPQRIAYVRDRDALAATISKVGGGEPRTFSWSRVPCPN